MRDPLKLLFAVGLPTLGVLAVLASRKKGGGVIEPTMGPENVIELEQGTSTEPMAYGSLGQVGGLLREYEGYLAAQGVNLDWFSIQELTKLRRTGKFAVPPRHLWDEMARTIIYAAQPIRAEFGSPLRIYNAYRPPWYNQLVGGAKRSLHIRNGALDLIPMDSGKRRELAELAARFFIANGDDRRVGMGIYNHPRMTGLHVDAFVRTRATPYAATRKWIADVQRGSSVA